MCEHVSNSLSKERRLTRMQAIQPQGLELWVEWKGKNGWVNWVSAFISLYFLTIDAMWPDVSCSCLAALLAWLTWHVCLLKPGRKANLPFLSCFYETPCHSHEKKKVAQRFWVSCLKKNWLQEPWGSSTAEQEAWLSSEVGLQVLGEDTVLTLAACPVSTAICRSYTSFFCHH